MKSGTLSSVCIIGCAVECCLLSFVFNKEPEVEAARLKRLQTDSIYMTVWKRQTSQGRNEIMVSRVWTWGKGSRRLGTISVVGVFMHVRIHGTLHLSRVYFTLCKCKVSKLCFIESFENVHG